MRQQSGGGSVFRLVGCASLVVSGAALVACGNDDNGSGHGTFSGGSTEAIDLTTVAGVRSQVATLGTLVSTLTALRTTHPAAARMAVQPKAACQDGGTREDTEPAAKDVGSPFTEQDIVVSGEKTTGCKFSATSDVLDRSVTLDGSSEGGTVAEDEGEVVYQRFGDSSTTPYEFAYTAAQSAGNDHLDTTLGFGVFYRLDALQRSETDGEARYVLGIGGDFGVTGSTSGTDVDVQGTFGTFIGKSGDPLIVTRSSYGYTVSGPFGFQITPSPSSTSCASGSVTIATTTALQLAAGATAADSPYSAGVVSLSSGGHTATVQFNADNSVTITPEGGTASTITYASATSAAASCVGFAFGGLLFASQAGS